MAWQSRCCVQSSSLWPSSNRDSWLMLCCSSRPHFFTRLSPKKRNLFKNTVNTQTFKNNCLDANGLFLMAFQFLNVGFMLRKQHHLFIFLTSEWWHFIQKISPRVSGTKSSPSCLKEWQHVLLLCCTPRYPAFKVVFPTKNFSQVSVLWFGLFCGGFFCLVVWGLFVYLFH